MSVLMHGPAFDESGHLVEREVPDGDVDAYVAAGYKRGPRPVVEGEIKDIPEPEAKSDLESLSKAELVERATAEGLDVTGMKKADIVELLNASE